MLSYHKRSLCIPKLHAVISQTLQNIPKLLLQFHIVGVMTFSQIDSVNPLGQSDFSGAFPREDPLNENACSNKILPNSVSTKTWSIL